MIQGGASALVMELDRWHAEGRSIALWLRDDDTVAPSSALDRLSRLAEASACPVLLAVIPMLAQPALGSSLIGNPWLLPCQHGNSHRNHAPAEAKKSEFGGDRDPSDVDAEIAAGRARLQDLLGAALLPVFVPPWNRIDKGHAARLPLLGFTGLSCFRGFGLPGSSPILVNSDIDIMDWHGGRVGRGTEPVMAETTARLAAMRQEPARTRATLGLLLHHRDHDDAAWTTLDMLLAVLTAHPAIACVDPRRLFSPSITVGER